MHALDTDDVLLVLVWPFVVVAGWERLLDVVFVQPGPTQRLAHEEPEHVVDWLCDRDEGLVEVVGI